MKYIAILSTFILLFASCADDLDKSPLDKFSEDKVWRSAEGAQTFINGTLYVSKLLTENADDWSDNSVVNTEMSAAVRTVRELMTNANDYGWNKFGEIRRCNLIIEKVTASEDIKEADKEPLIAQAKMLRSIVYYTRARLFGRLMIVDCVLTPDDDLMFPRSKTIKETYDFIINDLTEAAEGLPVTASAGALTKGAAYALKAAVCLQGAAFLTDSNEKRDYYQQAKKACEDLFALGIYSLESDYGKLFNDYSTGLSSKEVILATYYLSETTKMSGTWMQSIVPNQGAGKIPEEVAAVWPVENFEGWHDKSPSQDLVDAYEVVDADGNAKTWDEISYYKNFKPNVDYVSNAIYRNRDARFYSTIAYDSVKYFNSIITTRVGGNLYYLNNKEKDRHMTKTGYLYIKNLYQDKSVIAGVPTDWHLIHLRLGRSYLDYAEALLRLGETTTAIEYINKVRMTHGKLPALSTALSFDQAWKYYKQERRVELVQEEDRYWSLLRWGKEDGLDEIEELNTPPTAIEIAADGKSFEIIPVPVVGPSNDRKFTTRRYFLPIPKNETILNEKLSDDQNPGWE